MFKTPDAHFADSYFFKAQAVGTSTDAQVGVVQRLGQTEGGIRVRAWAEGALACASGNTVSVTLQVGDKKDSTAGTDWSTLYSGTVTATSTALSGELFSYIPESDKKFMRLSVVNSTGMTGNFSAAVEYVPR